MPAFVQGAHNNLGSGSAGSVTATFGAAATAGNTVVGIVSYGSTVTLNSVADGASHAFTILDTFTDGVNGQKASTFYLPNDPGGSTTVVATFSGSSAGVSISIAEYSGVAAASLDGHIGVLQATPGTGANGINSTAITTTAAGDIVIGLVAGTAGQVATFTAGSSPNAFTGRATTTDSGAPSDANLQIEDFVQSAAGSIAATFTQNAAGATISFVIGLKATVVAAGIALGQIASDIFVPGRRQGPMRGLRPTQNFSPPVPPPFVFIQDSPRWRSTAAAVLVLANLNTSFVPQPPAPPTLGWLQPLATPGQLARPQYDLNQGWVPQPPSTAGTPTPSALGWLQSFPTQTAPRPIYDLNQSWLPQPPTVAPPSSIETDSSQPGPVYQRTALYQAFATLPPPVAPVVVAPPIGWLQPFAVPPQLLRRYDLNQGWVPQVPSVVVVPPPPIGWLTAFEQPKREIVVANTVLSPFALPEIPVLGWFRPFDQPRPKAQPRYDLNSGWVAPVPAAAVVTPPSLGWLQPAAVPPRDTLVFDTIIEPFALPAPVISASAEVDIAQPGPVYTRTFIYQSLFAPPQAVGGVTPVVVSPLENDSSQPGPIYQRLALYQAFATLPPQPPAAVVAPPPLGWLSSFDQFYNQTYFYQSLVTPPQVPPVITTPSILGWLQPFEIPRQPVRLWDWNTAWPAQPPAPVAITPSALGWLQPFPIPPQPPRRPTFNEIYVPQNVGGTPPPPPPTNVPFNPFLASVGRMKTIS